MNTKEQNSQNTNENIETSKRDLTANSKGEVERTIKLERSRNLFLEHNRKTMRAYLVSVETLDDNTEEVQEDLQELGSLVRSLGDECVGATVQKRAKVNPHSLIGTGKAEEINRSCRELEVDYVVCDKDLSSSQVRNLEKIISKPVLDRTGIILQIFSKNAKTREAKTQVSIAHLEYLLPRLANAWITYERQRGSSGGTGNRVRGSGEMQIELDRRRVREKIASLKKDLLKIQKERETQRKGRSGEYNVVLVGYTNAGKTTIMNGLTDSQLSANNNLFETLDSSVRTLKGNHTPRILVTDTVGFIRNLPHSLVASFRSTLEETTYADLLIHVVDASHSRYQNQIRVTEEVLQNVGAGDVPVLYVFNKIDALPGGSRIAKILAKSYKNSICISAENKDDIGKLRDAVTGFLERNMIEKELEVPYKDSEKFRIIYMHTRVLSMVPGENSALFKIRAPQSTIKRYFEPQNGEENSDNQSEKSQDDHWNAGEFSYDFNNKK